MTWVCFVAGLGRGRRVERVVEEHQRRAQGPVGLGRARQRVGVRQHLGLAALGPGQRRHLAQHGQVEGQLGVFLGLHPVVEPLPHEGGGQADEQAEEAADQRAGDRSGGDGRLRVERGVERVGRALVVGPDGRVVGASVPGPDELGELAAVDRDGLGRLERDQDRPSARPGRRSASSLSRARRSWLLSASRCGASTELGAGLVASISAIWRLQVVDLVEGVLRRPGRTRPGSCRSTNFIRPSPTSVARATVSSASWPVAVILTVLWAGVGLRGDPGRQRGGVDPAGLGDLGRHVTSGGQQAHLAELGEGPALVGDGAGVVVERVGGPPVGGLVVLLLGADAADVAERRDRGRRRRR